MIYHVIIFFKKSHFRKLNTFLIENPTKADSIGSFIEFLVKSEEIYAFKVGKRFDLGNLEMCKEANKYFTK